MKNLANRIYEKNTADSGVSKPKKKVSQNNQSDLSPFEQRQKRMEESSREYKIKKEQRRIKDINRRKGRIYNLLRELLEIPSEKLKIILFSYGINANNVDSDLFIPFFKLYLNEKNFIYFLNKFKSNTLSSEDLDRIKENISGFEVNELCEFLDINPELNFFKKGQLANEFFNKIKEELSVDELEKPKVLFDSKELANFSKDLYVKTYGNEDIGFLKKKGIDIDEFFIDEDFNKKSIEKKDINKEKPEKKKKSSKKYSNSFKSSEKLKTKKIDQFNVSDVPKYELNIFTKQILDNTVQFNRKNTEDYLKGSFKNRLKRENISFDDGEIIVKRLIYESLDDENFNYGNRLLMLLELFKANIRNNKSGAERLNHPTNNIFNEIYNADYVEAENIIRYQIGLVAEKASNIDSKKEMEEKNKKLESERLMKRYGYDKKPTKKSSFDVKASNNQNISSDSKSKSSKQSHPTKKSNIKIKDINYDKLNGFIENNLSKIIGLNDLVLNTPPYYLSKKHRDDLIKRYSNTFNELNNMRLSENSISINQLESKNCDLSKINCDLKVLRDFNKIYNDLLNYQGLGEYFINKYGQRISQKKNYIRLANEKFIQEELKNNKEFFDNLFDESDEEEKVSLDNYQRRAVVIDEDNTQIIAGAGTGKTLTLQAKLKYLTKIKGVKDENILCLSYSKSSVEDLQDKVLETLGENEIDIRTFHSLGANILRYNDEDDRIYKGALDEVIENYFSKNIIKDPEKIKEIIKFFSLYFYVPISALECKIQDSNSKEYQKKGKFHINKENKNRLAYGEKLNKENFIINETMKNKVEEFLSGFDDKNRFKEFRKFFGGENEKITVKRERVRSLEELVIANYLFINGIQYEYESKFSIEGVYTENIIKKLSKLFFKEFDDYIPQENKENFIKGLNKRLFNSFDLNVTYHPDFYLPKDDIYIEHYGVNKDCEAPWLKNKDSKDYSDSMKWKRNLHKMYGNKLIETYSYYTDEKRLIKRLKEKLEKHKVEFNEINFRDLYEILIIESKLKEYLKFIDLIKMFINLFKSNGFNIDEDGNECSSKKFNEFREQNSQLDDEFNKERNRIFLDLVEDIYYEYQNHISSKNKIDFNDMVNDAVKSLKKDGEINNYEYILVDEYQDTSFTRYNLLKAIQEKIKSNGIIPKIIVVGDDWQSIYKFTGCNIRLFTEFNKYFDSPEIVKIQKTYRNSQALLDTTGSFIQKNKDQIRKKLESDDLHRKTPIKIVNYDSKCDKVLALEYSIINILEDFFNNKKEKLSTLNKEKFISNLDNEKLKDLEILLLGRNNKDIDDFLTNDLFSKRGNLDKDGYLDIIYNDTDIDIKFRTVHKSKGLEADYVILLNLEDKISGFPNQIENDEIIDFFFNDYTEDIEFAEERRLFYVALTRTKKDVYLLTPKSRRSIFIDDLNRIPINKRHIESFTVEASEEDCNRLNIEKNESYEVHTTEIQCPICGTGNVILIIDKRPEKFINNEPRKYFKCSNNTCYWYGGTYFGEVDELKYIDNCGNCDGVLYVKDGRNEPFLGCTKYYLNECQGVSLKNKRKEIVEKWFKEGRDFKSKHNFDPKTFKMIKRKSRKF